ncbi:MAG: nucleoside 2-deoxyribosyltransferase [Candidatus Cloacimonetes bacterium]|nr:nucleoside 2-deoxyribosyltransferase [Candidatus Cloacimonadota bacterium]
MFNVKELFTESCRFCSISEQAKKNEIQDTVLYEDEHFYVITTLGCMVKGYIMIVSKKHINSMCYLTAVEWENLELLINYFREQLKMIYGIYPVIFEHGASYVDTNKSACCVLHAHIHIVPFKLSTQEKMVTSLEMKKLENFKNLFSAGTDRPYVFFMDNDKNLFFHDASDTVLPSQLIRKWIAKDIGSECWDWRQYPFVENIIATIDDIKLAMKNENTKRKSLKYIYYSRAMDGLSGQEIEDEYRLVETKLAENGLILVNPFKQESSESLEVNKINSEIVIKENMINISQSDCVVVNLTKSNHLYVGCIAEMVYAKIKGCYVITVVGDAGAERHFYTHYHSDMVVKSLEEMIELSKGW